MSGPILTGVYAALLAPRDADGAMDEGSIRRQVECLAHDGINGYAVNGATGEFPIGSETDLAMQVRVVRSAAPSKQILAGIGAGDVRGAVLRSHRADDEGADAVLLPMPGYFPYRQDDLRAFALTVADASPLPVLLYNLPQFTSGLAADTVLSLLREHTNIAGIKDSSGSLDIVRAITASDVSAVRLIGNDSALAPALEEKLCDGVVSGVACVLPELVTRLFRSSPGTEEFQQSSSLLDEFIDQLAPLPTPWGLKSASEARGFTEASFPFPISAERAGEMAGLRHWLQEWLKHAV